MSMAPNPSNTGEMAHAAAKRESGRRCWGQAPILGTSADFGAKGDFGCEGRFFWGAAIWPRLERMGWDSNPRYGHPYSSFQDYRLSPLGHPSDVPGWHDLAHDSSDFG